MFRYVNFDSYCDPKKDIYSIVMIVNKNVIMRRSPLYRRYM